MRAALVLMVLFSVSLSVPAAVSGQDTTPPEISFQLEDCWIGTTWAQVCFETDEPAYGAVQWGEELPYDHLLEEAAPTLRHRFNLTSLEPGSAYHFRMIARDEASNIQMTQDFTLLTVSPPGPLGVNPWIAGMILVGILGASYAAARRFSPRRVGAAAGLAAAVGFIAAFAIAAALSPSFDFGTDYVSDLGVAEASALFNLALVAVCALGLVFFLYGLWPVLPRETLTFAGLAFGCAAAIAGALAGVYTENQRELHVLFSDVAFWGALGAGLALLRPMLRTLALGRPIAAAAAAASGIDAAFLALDGPGLETALVFAFFAWLLLSGVKLLKAQGKNEAGGGPAGAL